MSFRLPIALVLAASISAYASDNDKPAFQVGPATSFKQKQTISGVTVAAEAYDSQAQAGLAFGKLNPYEYGVLPVLLVIQNDSKQAIKLERMLAQYITPSRDQIEATPASDVPYLKAPKNPSTVLKSPIPGVGKPKKSPLLNPVIGERAFAARMLPPGTRRRASSTSRQATETARSSISRDSATRLPTRSSSTSRSRSKVISRECTRI